ncbi:MAG: phage protease [Oleispira sp.]|nr:phage protease [Oleispira sp.]
MKNTTTTKFAIAALTLAVKSEDSADANDAKIQLFPDGLFKANDGRPGKGLDGWLMSQEIADKIIAKVKQRANDIVVDYEHQTLTAEENGKEAPASGWIDPQSFEYRPGEGLFAAVKWTAKAATYIENEEYRFLSPVFPFDPKTGIVQDVFNVALTNFPALDGMAAVAVAALRSRWDQQEDDQVDRTELIKMLGLADDATEEQIASGIAALRASNTAYTALRTELGINEEIDSTTAIAALKSSAKPDLTQYQPTSVVEALKQQVADLSEGSEKQEVETLVTAALKDGRLVATQEQWAKDLGNTDVAALKGYLKNTPAIAALKGTQTQGKKPASTQGDEHQLNADELAVCKQMGISAADFAAGKAQENT